MMARKMARHAQKVTGVQPVMDFERTKRIYQNDIKRAKADNAATAQELSTAYKEIQNECHVVRGAAKEAFKLAEMEDHQRDDYLRSFMGVLKALGVTFTPDLVNQAKELVSEEFIPEAGKPKPKLVTVPIGDLADED